MDYKTKESKDLLIQLVEDGHISQDIAGMYCSELKESESEKIRKAIIQFIKLKLPDWEEFKDYSSWIEWLESKAEKIGETDTSEDEKVRRAILHLVRNAPGSLFKLSGVTFDEARAWLENKVPQTPSYPIVSKDDLDNFKRHIAVSNIEGSVKQGLSNWLEKTYMIPTMIQWTGNNLREVIDVIGLYEEGFSKWFHNDWDEYERYVHSHGNIIKIFNEDGSHCEVPVGAWIYHTPDGYNVASKWNFVPKKSGTELLSNNTFKVVPVSTLDRLYAAEKELEQLKGSKKSTKVPKPKFMEGDWVINKTLVDRPSCITNVREDYYVLEPISFIKFTDQDDYRLWTPKDAKPGDILATKDYIILLKKHLKKDGAVSYCHYDFTNKVFNLNEDDNWYFGKEAFVHPATKEQVDTLFKEMNKAGYSWDGQELKKVNEPLRVKYQKGTILDLGYCTAMFKEQVDEHTASFYCFYNDKKGFVICGNDDTFSLHQAQLATKLQYNLFFKKMHEAGYEWDSNSKELFKKFSNPESTMWNSEDEVMLNDIINDAEQSVKLDPEQIKWLKLRKVLINWKPNKDYLEALEFYFKNGIDKYGVFGRRIVELYDELKQL